MITICPCVSERMQWLQHTERVGARIISPRVVFYRLDCKSILEQTQPVEPMEQDVAAQISARRTVNRCSIRIVAEVSMAQPTLFAAADFHHRRRLLLGVNPEAGEEARYALEAKACRLRAKSEIPVDGVVKALVERPQLLPDPPAPEHRLLRNIVRPFEGLPVMWRQHPPTDFQAVFIDENPMTVDDIDVRFVL